MKRVVRAALEATKTQCRSEARSRGHVLRDRWRMAHPTSLVYLRHNFCIYCNHQFTIAVTDRGEVDATGLEGATRCSQCYWVSANGRVHLADMDTSHLWNVTHYLVRRLNSDSRGLFHADEVCARLLQTRGPIVAELERRNLAWRSRIDGWLEQLANTSLRERQHQVATLQALEAEPGIVGVFVALSTARRRLDRARAIHYFTLDRRHQLQVGDQVRVASPNNAAYCLGDVTRLINAQGIGVTAAEIVTDGREYANWRVYRFTRQVAEQERGEPQENPVSQPAPPLLVAHSTTPLRLHGQRNYYLDTITVRTDNDDDKAAPAPPALDELFAVKPRRIFQIPEQK